MKTRRRIIIVGLGAMLSLGAIAGLSLRRSAPLYRVTIVPSLGGRTMVPRAINDLGQVVGFAEAADGARSLFLWDRKSGMPDLGVTGVYFCDIDDAGRIAGTLRDPNGNDRAFIWDRARGVRMLGTLGGKGSQAIDLNSRGQVVGWSETVDGSSHAFVWDETAGMRDLGTPEGATSRALAVNERGQILGKTEDRNGRVEAVLWSSDDAAATPPEVLPRPGMHALNNDGHIVGVKYWLEDHRDFAFIWNAKTGFRKLFPVGDSVHLRPFINDMNQVLCTRVRRRLLDRITTELLGYRADEYLQDPTCGWVSLNRYVSTKGRERLAWCDLNNRGCILAVVYSGSRRSLRSCVILLEPIPQRWGK